jgi:fatty acid desaturase
MNALIVGLVRSRESTPAGLFLIFSTIFSAVSGAVLAESVSIFFPEFSLILRSFAVFWIGTRMRALGNMMHECSHGIFVRSATANTALGHLLAAADLTSFAEYSEQHASHHAHLGDPQRDLDYRARFFLLGKKKSLASIMHMVFSSILLIPLWVQILRPVFWDKRAPLWSNCVRLGYLCAVVLACAHPASGYFTMLYLIVPYLTSYQWMRIFSDGCDHLFLTEASDSNERSRNHLFHSSLVNMIIFPRNDGYHLLHHLFPTLPTRCYPETHHRLMQNPWYASRSHFIVNFKNRGESCAAKPVVQGQSR